MNLAIDVGNTRVKVAVFADNSLVWTDVFDKSEFEKAFHHILQKYPDLTHCILAMVGSFSGSLLALVGQRLKLLTLHSDTALPFKNDYGSPKTLGVDRMALTAAAVNRYPGKDVLIIDAGSCITYDLITSEGNYKEARFHRVLKCAIEHCIRLPRNCRYYHRSRSILKQVKIPTNPFRLELSMP